MLDCIVKVGTLDCPLAPLAKTRLTCRELCPSCCWHRPLSTLEARRNQKSLAASWHSQAWRGAYTAIHHGMPHPSMPGCAVQVRLVLEESGTPGRYGKDIQGVQPFCLPALQLPRASN